MAFVDVVDAVHVVDVTDAADDVGVGVGGVVVMMGMAGSEGP